MPFLTGMLVAHTSLNGVIITVLSDVFFNNEYNRFSGLEKFRIYIIFYIFPSSTTSYLTHEHCVMHSRETGQGKMYIPGRSWTGRDRISNLSWQCLTRVRWLNKCLLACFLVWLIACLLIWLIACSLACWFACSLACLLISLIACGFATIIQFSSAHLVC